METRLIEHLDDPFAGPMNMAIDQALAESVDQGGPACLRLYRWREATLSLGYFQRCVDRQEHPWSLGLPMVRRSTGGGAIIHDQELTYSLCLRSDKSQRGADRNIYSDVHQSIIAAIKSTCGEDVRRFCDSGSDRLRGDNPFLCFERRTDEDLIAAGYKVTGSAQRRVGNALLQHGSIMLSTSEYSPSLPGLQCVTGLRCCTRQLAQSLCKELNEKLGVLLNLGGMTERESLRSGEIAKDRFESDGWNQRR